MTDREIDIPPGRWLHRFTVLAVCLIWPLIWVGGLVTTYDAGMAVPDWPGTYGYNLFLYPIGTWLSGPFDLFIEHGHRLLGAVVGMVAIVIVGLAARQDPRRWVLGLAIGILLAVVSQGVLGGLRVVLSDRTLAMLHGCFGPAVFALCVVAAVVTSRFWWRNSLGEPVFSDSTKPESVDRDLRPIGRGFVFLTAALVAIAYTQLLLGAQIRHVQPDAPPGRFAMLVAAHVVIAFFLWAITALAWWRFRRCGDLTLSRPGLGLIGLVAIQITLGIGTWVVSYGWPSFLQWFPGASGFRIESKGFVDSIVVTAHVATGSLILAVSTMVLVRVLRIRHHRIELSSESGTTGDSSSFSATT